MGLFIVVNFSAPSLLSRVKGKHFTIPNLLASARSSEGKEIPDISVFDNCALAIFRLAPADYHRFHSPADVIVGDVVDIEGSVVVVSIFFMVRHLIDVTDNTTP